MGSLLALVLPPFAVSAQRQDADRPLRVLLAITSEAGGGDAEVSAAFTRLLRQANAPGTSPLPFTTALVGSTDHDTDCSELEGDDHRGVLATLQPLVYIRCRTELGGDTALVPLFVVRKNGEPVAYYAASLVVAKASPIRSVHDSTIRHLYLNHPRSASGFVAPLQRLAELRVIDAPSVAAAEARFGRTGVVFLRRRWDVARKTAEDPFGMGAVAGYDTTKLRAVDSANRYAELPQDVMVVTGELRQYADVLRRIIPQLFVPDARGSVPGAPLATSAYGITGVEPFGGPFRSMYNDLAAQYTRVTITAGWTPWDAAKGWIAAVAHGVEEVDKTLKAVVGIVGSVAAISAWLVGQKRRRRSRGARRRR